VQQNSIFGFLGPNGAGKSTLLRLIAGLEEISSGEIAIAGKVVNQLEPADRDIAMVFQNYALYPHMTAYKNMAFGLTLRQMSKSEIDVRVREAAEILGITNDQLQRKPKELSGGQRQRVVIGRAWCFSRSYCSPMNQSRCWMSQFAQV
jgi:ABC-type sugar transport system ATPase subunit